MHVRQKREEEMSRDDVPDVTETTHELGLCALHLIRGTRVDATILVNGTSFCSDCAAEDANDRLKNWMKRRH